MIGDEPFTDAEVWSALASFGLRGFDEAAEKWSAGKYSSNRNECCAGYRRWQAMRQRAKELLNEAEARG